MLAANLLCIGVLLGRQPKGRTAGAWNKSWSSRFSNTNICLCTSSTPLQKLHVSGFMTHRCTSICVMYHAVGKMQVRLAGCTVHWHHISTAGGLKC